MFERLIIFPLLFVTILSVSPITVAEVVHATDDHFELHHVGESSRTVEAMWNRLVQPQEWWDPDHSYSGDAKNLSLELKAGGRWLERWEGGEVVHGTVVLIKQRQQLKLDAPFGPLLDLAVKDVWTITLEATDHGTRVEFHEVVNGTTSSALKEMAEAVDFVRAEAMRRLVAE